MRSVHPLSLVPGPTALTGEMIAFLDLLGPLDVGFPNPDLLNHAPSHSHSCLPLPHSGTAHPCHETTCTTLSYLLRFHSRYTSGSPESTPPDEGGERRDIPLAWGGSRRRAS